MSTSIRETSDGLVYQVDDKVQFRVAVWVEPNGYIRLRIEGGNGAWRYVEMPACCARHLSDVLRDCAKRGSDGAFHSASPSMKRGKRKSKKSRAPTSKQEVA